jgi:hypothetical protein
MNRQVTVLVGALSSYTLNPRLLVTSSHKMITNSNPPGRTYTEPSFVQFGSTVVAVVRAEQDGGGSPAIIVKWNPYTTTPAFTYQSFTGVLANSHHLLKTAGGKVLFTYGDKAQVNRPTVGMLISNPTATWVKSKVVPIYNSGHPDQANPSSVEIATGTFLTLGYNARPKSVSATGRNAVGHGEPRLGLLTTFGSARAGIADTRFGK